jgi:hypothetical protein
MKKIKICLLLTIAVFFTVLNDAMPCPSGKCYHTAMKYSEPGQPIVILCDEPGSATCCLSCSGGGGEY